MEVFPEQLPSEAFGPFRIHGPGSLLWTLEDSCTVYFLAFIPVDEPERIDNDVEENQNTTNATEYLIGYGSFLRIHSKFFVKYHWEQSDIAHNLQKDKNEGLNESKTQ